MRLSHIYKIMGPLCIILVVVSLCVGALPLVHLLKNTSLFWLVMEHLRLPRTLMALIVGGGLGFTGAFLQGFLRNPLADPSIVGISSGASFGAVLGMALGFPHTIIITMGTLGASLCTVFLHQTVSRYKDLLTFILVGLTLNSFLGALTALVLNFSTNPYKSLEMLFWLFGSVSHQSLFQVLGLLIPCTIGGMILWKQRHILDALSFGEIMAKNMGHNMDHAQKKMILGTALVVGPLVALGGIVGFIGLITPHMLREILKAKPSQLLLPSALAGALLCLLADISVRVLSTGNELKIGVLTSFLGAPFFLYLVLKKGLNHADKN